MKDNIKLLYIDLFCGAGGTSTGVELARVNGQPCAKVIACVNHDANAIASHASNHPDALHFTEDIRTLDLTLLIIHVKKYRLLYPDAKVVLWASLECTNFSKAKGGQPRDADSRTLAEHLFRYIEALNPDYIYIENVEEFMSWGDMDEKGHPISMERGKRYIQWVSNIKKYQYNYDHRILNAADYGAYTTRKRFFGIFAKYDLPIIFPEPTYCKYGSKNIFGELKKWKPVKDVLDFSDEGESIFGRKKPLVEKTLERIYAGLIKFIAGGKVSINKNKTSAACFLSKQYSGDPDSKNISIDMPAGTITTIDHHALINNKFLCSYNFKDSRKDINKPCPTLLTKDRLSLISPRFIANEYSGGGQLSSINDPNPAVLTSPKQKLITCKPWIMNTAFNNIGSSINVPAQTVTANRKWHYLMNPQFNSAGGSIDKPCFTLIARMDKMPPYLIATKTGKIAIKIFDADTPMTIKIKKFMAMYGIVDIKMRMLRIPELKKIMGFPENYTLIGTQAEQKKYIGNAVEVNMAKVLCEALCQKLNQLNKIVA